jgi:23S rRNA (uracil1939-C5)-methyltransferase
MTHPARSSGRLPVGERLTLTIDRLSLGGEGVARHEGRVLFVPFTVPGDTIEAEVIEAQDRFARARLRRILNASPDRRLPPCPYHYQPPGSAHPEKDAQRRAGISQTFFCGGCTWQQIDYAAQLKAKRAMVQETLERVGKLSKVEVAPVLGMQDPWRYRNKVQQPVGWDARRRATISGFYAPASHDIVPIEDCLVQPTLSVDLLNAARDLLESYGLRAYDETDRSGWIRHMLARTTTDGYAMLVFVTRTPDFPHEREILTELARAFPALASVHQNVHPAATNVILGRQWRKLAGRDWLEERLGRLRFRLAPGAFFQINSAQAEVLYNVTRKMAGRGERLLDLYCGVGSIALWLADQFESVVGVEEVPEAINNAKANAQMNRIPHARFIAAPVERFVRGVRREKNLTVTLDPPRAGCSPDVLKALKILSPERIIYVSCDPGTLARDLGVLTQAGFRVDEVQPVDLFPQTHHIETAVKLTKADRR